MAQALRYYVVSFLVPNAQVAAGVQAVLKSNPDVLHVFGSTYVLGTTEKATDIINRMVPFLGGSDRVMIVQIARRPRLSGWMSKDEWNWLHDRLLAPPLPLLAREKPLEVEHHEGDSGEE